MSLFLFDNFNKYINSHPSNLISSYTPSIPINLNDSNITSIISCLPADLLDFYHINNGIYYKWGININSIYIPLGIININKIEDLNVLDTKEMKFIYDEALNKEYDGLNLEKKLFNIETSLYSSFSNNNTVCNAFELDNTSLDGKVILVSCLNTSGNLIWSVWFQDLTCTCYYLANSFSAYLSLLLCHLGIPLWQYAFTPLGMPSATAHWLRMFAPERLRMDNSVRKNLIERETREVVDKDKEVKKKDRGRKKIDVMSIEAVMKSKVRPVSALNNNLSSDRKRPLSAGRTVVKK